MFKTILLSGLLLFLVGCQGTLKLPQKKEVQYIEFEDYKSEVVPKLDKGYDVLERYQVQRRHNITPEQFLARVKNNLKLSATDIVMVDTDIVDGMYHFDACYLKEVDLDKMVFGAVLNFNMPMELRKAFNSNKGCALGKIYYNTPAYNSDIHENDIVKFANGEEINSCHHFKEILDSSHELDLTLWVNGQLIEVNNVLLNKRKNFQKLF